MRLAVFVVAAVASAPALAQHPAVVDCRSQGVPQARIACLEAALNALYEPERPASHEPLPRVKRDPEAKPPAAGSPAVVDTQSPDAPATISESLPSVERGTARQASVIAPVQPAARAAGLGAEQVEARRGEAAARSASATGLRVQSYATVPYRRLQVTLENGQVWRQIEGDVQRFRVDLERNQTVDIVAAPISGYRLRLNEINRTIRVERIR